MSTANAITMLKHWILEGRQYGIKPGISDLAAIVVELEEEPLCIQGIDGTNYVSETDIMKRLP